MLVVVRHKPRDGSIDTFTDRESWMDVRGTEPVAQIPRGCDLPNFLAVMQNNTVGLLAWNWK